MWTRLRATFSSPRDGINFEFIKSTVSLLPSLSSQSSFPFLTLPTTIMTDNDISCLRQQDSLRLLHSINTAKCISCTCPQCVRNRRCTTDRFKALEVLFSKVATNQTEVTLDEFQKIVKSKNVSPFISFDWPNSVDHDILIPCCFLSSPTALFRWTSL